MNSTFGNMYQISTVVSVLISPTIVSFMQLLYKTRNAYFMDTYIF